MVADEAAAAHFRLVLPFRTNIMRHAIRLPHYGIWRPPNMVVSWTRPFCWSRQMCRYFVATEMESAISKRTSPLLGRGNFTLSFLASSSPSKKESSRKRRSHKPRRPANKRPTALRSFRCSSAAAEAQKSVARLLILTEPCGRRIISQNL